MPVPHANPAVVNRVVEFFGAEKPLCQAVEDAIEKAGAKRPSPKRYIAIEAIYGLPRDAPNQPPHEVFCERALAHARKVFGEANVVKGYLHLDEQSPHVHVVAVPLVQAWPPGYKKARQAGQTPPWCVTWNVFSGSSKPVFETLPSGKVKRRNPVMASWQTEWAAMWADYGFERGQPSSRRKLKPAHLYGTTAEYQQLAEVTRQQMLDEVQTYPWEAEVLGKKFIGAVLADLISKQLESHARVLTELARRGIQLPSERDARIETAQELSAAQKQLVATLQQIAALEHTVAALASSSADKDRQILALQHECEYQQTRAKLAEEELDRHFGQAEQTEKWQAKPAPTPTGLGGPNQSPGASS